MQHFNIELKTGVGLWPQLRKQYEYITNTQGCSLSVMHGFTGCGAWFTTVNISLRIGKHGRLPTLNEHATTYLNIKIQTGGGGVVTPDYPL